MELHVDIRKRLGPFKLDVRFDFTGGTMALLGASGSGKSMTLKCIAGIETPDEGQIILNGKALYHSARGICLSPRERGIGYLFQSYALFPNMTARENIEIAAKGNRARRKAAAEEKIAALYLEGLGDKYPRQLSGGQQQRVALARIFASEPDILLLDEPFAALDSYLKWRIEMDLTDTLKRFGLPALFVSHSRDEVFRMCERVCVINEGRSEPLMTARQLFLSPDTLSSALLSGCKNFSRAKRLGDRRVLALDWGCELRTDRDVPEDIGYIGVRAHFVRPSVSEEGANVIPCRVTRITEELFSAAVMLRPVDAKGDGDYSCLRMELGKEEWASLAGRDSLRVRIDEKDILLLK